MLSSPVESRGVRHGAMGLLRRTPWHDKLDAAVVDGGVSLVSQVSPIQRWRGITRFVYRYGGDALAILLGGTMLAVIAWSVYVVNPHGFRGILETSSVTVSLVAFATVVLRLLKRWQLYRAAWLRYRYFSTFTIYHVLLYPFNVVQRSAAMGAGRWPMVGGKRGSCCPLCVFLDRTRANAAPNGPVHGRYGLKGVSP